jgi:hypothetical protein
VVLDTASPRHLVKASPDTIRRIADQLEPDLQAAFLRALETLRRQIPLDDLTVLLEAGNLTAISELVNQIQLPSKALADTQKILLEAVTQAANATGTGFGLSFELTNPAAIRWAETRTGELITGVTKETRKAIQDIVRAGQIGDLDVRLQARQIRRVVGLTERDAGAVTRFLTGLLDDPEVSRGFAERQADKMRARLLRHRAEMIARTETMTAANRGQLQAWNDAADAGLLRAETTRRVWIATEDDRLCPICAVLDGQTVSFTERFISREQATGFDIKPGGQDIQIAGLKPLKEPVSSMTPPAHPGCRCAVGLEFE